VSNIIAPDLCDEFPEVQVVEPGFNNYGGIRQFGGEIVTVKCFEDNSVVKEQVGLPGNGRVMVVDGGASKRNALLGDMLVLSGLLTKFGLLWASGSALSQ